ncbi:MAG: GIY-YIG nuclease family protein [Ignavibacteriaceae bacterium]|nr:GIY-YIG nuclease family protein [Ignavibacteriaceae bacterium]
MYYIYILKSKDSNHFYIGHTADLEKRLSEHNSGRVKSTKKYLPWQVIYFETANTKSEAYKREMQIKSYKGGNAFKKLIGG